MTIQAVNIKVGQSLGEGRYSSSVKGAALPAPTLATLSAAITTALTDITAALAVPNISGDPTSVTAVTLVQTDVTAIQTAANALVLALSSDVSVAWDGSTVTHRNQLREALRVALKAVESGYGTLAE